MFNFLIEKIQACLTLVNSSFSSKSSGIEPHYLKALLDKDFKRLMKPCTKLIDMYYFQFNNEKTGQTVWHQEGIEVFRTLLKSIEKKVDERRIDAEISMTVDAYTKTMKPSKI